MNILILWGFTGTTKNDALGNPINLYLFLKTTTEITNLDLIQFKFFLWQ